MDVNDCIDDIVHLFGVDAAKKLCKYRADKKCHEEDIAKAEWYVTKLVELEGKK